jgi:hypothetical protein
MMGRSDQDPGRDRTRGHPAQGRLPIKALNGTVAGSGLRCFRSHSLRTWLWQNMQSLLLPSFWLLSL